MRVNKKTTQLSDAHEGGAVAVLVAIVSLLLVICIAFAVDLGYAWQVRRSMVKATDAAALSAAQEARNASINGAQLLSGSCNPLVQIEAATRLTANRSDAVLDFCTLGASPGSTKGVVTVRATSQAELSFAGLIGKNKITVSSSSSAKWGRAQLLPIAVCVGSTNSPISDWVNGMSPGTYQQTIGASSADTSSLCSSGSSGAFGVIDLGNILPTGGTPSDFDTCRSEQTVSDTLLAQLADPSSIPSVKVGDFRCAKTGQYYGDPVDRAICSIPRGTRVAVPLVTESPFLETRSGVKQWIVKISGFALVSLDNYTGNRGAPLCNNYTVGAGHQPRGLHARTQLVSSRHRGRPTLRKAAVSCRLFSLDGSTWPLNITLPGALTLKSDITLTCSGGPGPSAFSFQITIDPGLTGLIATDITGVVSGLTATVCAPISQTMVSGVVKITCTVNFSNSDVTNANTIASVFIKAPLKGAGNLKVSACITLSAIDDADVADNAWPRHALGTSCAPNAPIHPITVASSTSSTSTSSSTTVPPTSTTLPAGEFREIRLTFISYFGTGSSSGITSYEICRINIKTSDEAQNLVC